MASGRPRPRRRSAIRPVSALKPGSMGRPLPGYAVALVAADGSAGEEGEICLDLKPRPVGLMQAYLDDPDKTADVMRDGYYHTGDVASRDADGYLTYVGRLDDVFKSSDYRISPFELESVLIEHPAVAEAAVVPSPDPLRLAVPKAFVVLAAGARRTRRTARSILEHRAWTGLAVQAHPASGVRGLCRRPFPGRSAASNCASRSRRASRARGAPQEFWEEDFAEAAPIVPRPPPV